jgi:hypothetical protein
MRDNSKYHYIQFPISLLRNLYLEKESTMNNILDYGILKYSTKLSYTIEAVAKQTIYFYFRGKNDRLRKLMNDFDLFEIGEADESELFYDETFHPPQNLVEEVLRLFKESHELQLLAIKYFQLHLALEFLEMKGSIDSIVKNGERISSNVNEKEPFVMAKTNLIVEFRDKDKSEQQLLLFASYCAIKSILGKKDIVKTNKALILSRMFGYRSTKDLPINLQSNGAFLKYCNRYHMDKLIGMLEMNWKVKTYSRYTRGLYVSIGSKISLSQLIEYAESTKSKNKLDALKKEKKMLSEEIRIKQLLQNH